ncbi:MAG: DUF1553 domain-containing protein, partial [Gemmataceae bacterium]|nr:DUF1553 domain-containing protein [Gemmataceae bacterium]
GRGTVFGRFDGDDWGDWRVAGEAFGARPSRNGDFLVRAGTVAEPLRPVNPGLAHSGCLSTNLHGSLRSPTFTIKHSRIHYRLAGQQVQVRLVLNGLQLIQDPIYGGLKFTVDNEAMHWRTQNVGMWRGQRAYIEILDDGPGYVALEQVVFSDDPSPPELPSKTLPQPKLITDANRAEVERCLDVFRKAEAAVPAPQRCLATADGSAVDEHVFIRGNPKNLGPVQPRRFLEVFGGKASASQSSGRLQLAEQLIDPAQTPIVPRVFVNRAWQHLFGEGIVRSPDDFGVLGQAPTHPELLDFLALEFVRNGWSLKKLLKGLILSSTYQMASHGDTRAEEVDPANTLLHKMPVRRLEGEAIRDAVLAVSGRLDPTPFGPSVPVHLTPFMLGRGRPANSGPLDGQGRRSIYLAVRRNFLTPMLVAFDYPTPFTTIGRRSVSNVPAQALTMLNNPLILQQAELWAKRVLAEPNLTPEQRFERMVQASLGRPPTAAESAEAMAFLREQERERGRMDDLRSWSELAHVLFNLKEFVYLN